MVLADIGAMERPFVQWLAEMEAIDPGIFHRLHDAWIDRFGARVVSTFEFASHPPLRRTNMVRQYVPIRACMMPELIGRAHLPYPPKWFRRYADEAVINSSGFPISSQLPGESKEHSIVYRRNGMLSYLAFFNAEGSASRTRFGSIKPCRTSSLFLANCRICSGCAVRCSCGWTRLRR